MAYDKGEYQKSLQDKHAAIQDQITELTVLEDYLFQEMGKVRKGGGADEAKATAALDDKIGNLKNIRLGLLNNLRELYTKASDGVNSSTAHLSNQTDLTKTLEGEIDKANIELKQLHANKNNKTRLAQVGEYEFEKNKEHRSILLSFL